MGRIDTGLTTKDLDSIGSVEELGATIEEGDVQAFIKMTLNTPQDAVSAGYFGTTSGRFRMVYPFTEQACLISGEVILTNETTQERIHYKAGDSWLYEKGTPVLWEVVSSEFVKHYLAVV
ncbi:cupin domain-containing protein [Salinicola sp. DM10]|uniref:cupin domain-containing protein n=1 Tax=Salinicola sp. DM10 TaxID=2815721 RepID=UPI001A901E7B|nr:cupin domain-containing protein [Salinicola sp. DM10]MCE3028086.1 cupin domain-containing protein [Salinicola sp. DM10]